MSATIADNQLPMNELVQILEHGAVLLIVLAGIAFMIPGAPKRIGGNLFFYGIISVVVAGIGPELLTDLYDFAMGLPWWALIIVGGLLVLSALQVFVALFLGRQAAASFAGSLLASLFIAVFWILLAPFHRLRRFFRGPGE